MKTKTQRGSTPRRIVGQGRGKPAEARRNGKLSRGRIADAAMALVDRDGLDALSFRNLGAALGCEAMSIYHHFPSKAHLMDALVDLMLDEIVIQSAAEEPDWVARLRHTAHSFRAAALKHPKL